MRALSEESPQLEWEYMITRQIAQTSVSWALGEGANAEAGGCGLNPFYSADLVLVLGMCTHDRRTGLFSHVVKTLCSSVLSIMKSND